MVNNTYIVKNTDTLNEIGNKFKVPVNVLEQFNGYNVELIPGMKLIIPNMNNQYISYYMVSKGDTLYKIANDNNINVSLLARLNGLNETDYIYPRQVLLIPKAGSILYFTQDGDTLSDVANKMKTSINNLIDENKNIYLQPEQLIVYQNK